MKTQHPHKKLTLVKKTIAHLNLEQMKLALAGEDIITTDTGIDTFVCKQNAVVSMVACLTLDCL